MKRIGSLAPPSPKARSHVVLFTLTGSEQGAVFPLHGTSAWLGRAPDLLVTLHDDAVSKRHAHITRRSDGRSYIEDKGSRNGTFVNDERVLEPRLLADGDHVRVGNTILRFSMLDDLEERALTNLYDLTVRDPLTRAYNRRHLGPHLKGELAFAARQRTPLAILLVDIDHFKRVNDSFGHHAGDIVLQLVAGSIQRLLRPYDLLCRYGGEEFLVVARDTSLRNAEILAERIRRHIEALRFDAGGAQHGVSVSVGVTVAEPQSEAYDAAALLELADAAMYDAKRTGRNRVSARPSKAPLRDTNPGFAQTIPPAPDSAAPEAPAFRQGA